MDRRQFVKLTGVGAGGALAAGTASGQQTIEPAAEQFEFTAVSDDVRIALNDQNAASDSAGITLNDVTPPLDIDGTASNGTWTSSPTTVTGQEIIDAFRDFNNKTDIPLEQIIEDALDTTIEDIVATLLEDLSVETLLANSNGDELFRIIADIIDALDLDPGQGADIINAIDAGTAILPDEVDTGIPFVGTVSLPSILEILEAQEVSVSIITISGFDLGTGNADKLLAGDVPRQERANLLQQLLERVNVVLDSIPDIVTGVVPIPIPAIPPLNDATDLVALGDWLLTTITELQSINLGGGSSTNSLQQLEAKLSDDPDRAELERAVAELETEQQTVSADGGTATADDTVSTQQQDTTTIIDRLLANDSVSALDSELNTIATELRNQGFDAVLTGIDIPSQQDLLSTLLDLLEAQLTLDVNIGEISGTYDPNNGTMTVPLTQDVLSADASFQNGLLQLVQDFIDQITNDTGGGGGGGGSNGIIDEIVNAIDPEDTQALLDEFRAEIEKQNLISSVPPLELLLTTAGSGGLDGAFAVEDGPAGGQVTFVENEFTVGYDQLVTDIGNIDVPTVLDNVEITSVSLKSDLVDPIPDSTWDSVATTLGTQLQGFAQSGGGFENNPIAFLENNISGVSDFSTFLDGTVTSLAGNITPENLLADIAAEVDTATVVSLVTGVAPQAFTDSTGRHAVEATFTLVGRPEQFAPNATPDDIDGDGLYENIMGQADSPSDINILDTQMLFSALEDGTAQKTPRAFNFSEAGPDDEVTILDVAAHWRTFVAGE